MASLPTNNFALLYVRDAVFFSVSSRLKVFFLEASGRATRLALLRRSSARIISRAENREKFLSLPRGCLSDVEALLAINKIELRLGDARSMGHPMNAMFQGVLRPDQQEALDAVTKHDFGMLIAPTAFGKTVTAVAVIAKRKVSTLVIVHPPTLCGNGKSALAVSSGWTSKKLD